MTTYKGKAVRGRKGFMPEGKGIGANGKQFAARFPPELAEILESIPNRSEYIREAVIERLKKDGLLE
ncbi:hypothetical protein WA1_18930 [Scytonema hofmannii PCC 7110]|uniref:Uncharacterized protein n=1 Tax=Scytonema hofmannii PCC 7110 TaxID=128403 RepID=A0A139XBJ1_9CYAN|nr:hypothetical protein [Scytonema hofmannii]KYC42078.1 hypothetical protein WA1_18930 [Scytonema hofmannii PCC 7110]